MFIPIIFSYSIFLSLNRSLTRLIPISVRHYIRL
nr:MAG TPA: hypothetical protein [Caudoviricetes sp.]